ncbi:MAG: response regulator transcription factor [Acidimicrobiales bacterium]
MTAPPQSTASRPRRVLVVDDDPDARWLAVDALAEHGFDVNEAETGQRAQEQVGARSPDLVVLDLGLPDMAGLDVLKWLRAAGDVPVIVVTGRGDRSDRVVGLELGADDYVVKPFDPRELVARVNAVLRRGRVAESDVLDFGDLTIDLLTRDVVCRGVVVELTTKEFELLACLARSPRQVFSRAELLDKVWGSSPDWQDPGTVNEHIHRLRRKIEVDASNPRWIGTLRGAGYRFTP